ncbi:MAG: p-hydroxyphenylacetate 3-hydroxylase, reductase component [Stenotrophomonas maltophilia]|uniref:p-hydroxyphenylacetate 3-hydroxylase, reductase component n=1 Tax=Stenotrophomonas maltophilia TaxID=40324 RepID=A0A7V8JMX5_STEMA|nr:MAG: p-hydroxyphenylacetate 3-hydroxylase, reductase component [Stenotrophomonas maltophilia]
MPAGDAYAGPWAGVFPAPEPLPSVALPPRALRRMLGHFPTGVAIVCARDGDGRPVGLTINSFVPVSLQPPLVLWNLALHAQSMRTFQRAPRFCISVLAADQHALARRFSDPKVGDRFDGVALEQEDDPNAPPRIAGALLQLQCTRHAQWPVGDHLLLAGRIIDATENGGAPLLFHRGRFQAGPVEPLMELVP